MKGDKRSYKQENTLSINMGRKSIYLFNLSDRDNPIELAFQPKYGDINTYTWFGDGYIMLAFNEGYFVVISTRKRYFYGHKIYLFLDMKEIGQELFSSKFYSSLKDISYSSGLQKAAICGDNSIKVLEAGNWKVPTVLFLYLQCQERFGNFCAR
jgi:WD repeat-containing protein 19